MVQVSKANIKKAKTRYYSSGSLGRDLYVSELSSLPLEDLKALHVEVKANLSFYKSELNTLAPEEVEKVKFQRFINTFFIKAIEAEVTQRRERDKKAAQMERVEREVFIRMLKGTFGSDAIDEIVRLSREVAKAQFPAEG
jgi:hypothetical protein